MFHTPRLPTPKCCGYPQKLAALCFFLIPFQQASFSANAHNQIRIAHYICDSLHVPDNFLSYAQKYGYNHVIGHAELQSTGGRNDWIIDKSGNATGYYNWSDTAPQILYKALKSHFERADRYNLKFIPCFNLSSRWAWHWKCTNDYIDFNKVIDDDGNRWIVPPLAPDTIGMDRSFTSYLEVISKSFRNATLTYTNLDFIHIGHDEMVSSDGEMLMAASSGIDQNWIENHGNNANAYYSLIASEIVRRTMNIRQIFPQTRSIVWADAFDCQQNGNIKWSAWSSKGRRTVRIITKKVIMRPELNAIRDYLVLMPWQYSVYSAGNKIYDPKVTLKFFAEKGFKVLWGCGYESWKRNGLNDGRAIMKKMVATTKEKPKYSKPVIGFCAHHFWDGGTYWNDKPRPELFQLIPDLSEEAQFNR